MQIIDNKALLLKVRDPQKIITVIPKSRLLDSGEVLVHWGLEESQVLKNLRYKSVPIPFWDNTNGLAYTNHLAIRRLLHLS